MASAEPLALAVCSDANVLPGVHVTLHTALRKLPSDRPARVFWVTHNVSEREIEAVRETVRKASPGSTLETIPMDVSRLKGLAPLHGNLMPYAPLYLADMLPDVDRLLYLDSDLYVDLDLSPTFDVDLEGHWLAVPYDGSTVDSGLDGPYIIKTFGFDPKVPYFNTGFLLFSLAEWRRRGLDARVADILREHGDTLPLVDQTVINVLAHGDFLRLPAKLNNKLSTPDGKYHDFSGTVGHLIDRPKPWDACAGLVNPYVRVFNQALDETAMKGWRPNHLEIFTTKRRYLRSFARRFLWRLVGRRK